MKITATEKNTQKPCCLCIVHEFHNNKNAIKGKQHSVKSKRRKTTKANFVRVGQLFIQLLFLACNEKK